MRSTHAFWFSSTCAFLLAAGLSSRGTAQTGRDQPPLPLPSASPSPFATPRQVFPKTQATGTPNTNFPSGANQSAIPVPPGPGVTVPRKRDAAPTPTPLATPNSMTPVPNQGATDAPQPPLSAPRGGVGESSPAPAPAPGTPVSGAALAPTATPTPAPTLPVVGMAFSPLGDTTLDSILVTVGDEPVLLSDLQKVVRAASNGQTRLKPNGQLAGGSIGPSEANQLLEQVINQKVLNLRVREMGLNVDDDELTTEIDNFLKSQNISQEQFQQILKSEGETQESHRDEFRQQLETQRFIGRVIRPLVTVTEDEVRSYYQQQAGAADRAQRVRLRSLVIDMPASLSEAQRQAKLERVATVKKEIEAGANFAGLVKLYSESPDALKTEGLLPPRPAKELPGEVREKLKDAKPDTVIGPLTLGSSVFFFQYVGADSENQDEFARNRTKWEGQLQEIKFRERLDEYVKAERSKTKVVKRDFEFVR